MFDKTYVTQGAEQQTIKPDEKEVPEKPSRFRRFYLWIRKHIKKFSFMAWGIVALLMILWVPSPTYYLALLPVFIGILHLLISKLVPVEFIIVHDFEEGEINVTAMSAHSMYDYSKQDSQGEASDILYWFKGERSRVAVLDKIDEDERIMTINPISSSVDFIKNYRMAMVELRKLANDLSNTLVKLSHEMDLRTIFKAYEIFKDSGALNLIVQARPKMPMYQSPLKETNMDKGGDNANSSRHDESNGR